MTTQGKACSNPDCHLVVDGKCVEGLPLDECPHVNELSVEDIEEIEEVAAANERADVPLILASGEVLERGRTSVLQRAHPSRTIGLVGPYDSGKTSLIAGIYDLLQDGPVAGIGFAGSETLIGFEKVCHDARSTSRRKIPYTERTSVGADATFFHLDLRISQSGLISLFLGDRSGEDYLAAMDELARANEFFELRRADCVTLLVNGEQLADPKQRHEAKALTPQIVNAVVEAGLLRKNCRLAIVLTKKDVVLTSGCSERVYREFDELVAAVTDQHSTRLGEIKSFIVAASPKDCAEVSRGEGVGDLLSFWLGMSSPISTSTTVKIDEQSRMIDRLAANGDAWA